MKNLKKQRKVAEKTQDEIADVLGVARNTYSRYETGEREPDFNTLIKLAEYFNTTTDYLLGKSDDPAPPSKKEAPPLISRSAMENDIIKRLMSLSFEEQTELLKYLEYLAYKRDEAKTP